MRTPATHHILDDANVACSNLQQAFAGSVDVNPMSVQRYLRDVGTIGLLGNILGQSIMIGKPRRNTSDYTDCWRLELQRRDRALLRVLCFFAVLSLLRAFPVFGQTFGGTVQIPSESVPFSSFASPEAKQEFLQNLSSSSPKLSGGIAEQRAYYGHFNDVTAERMKVLYPVRITKRDIGGVHTEVVVPADGVSPENASRVLINLHGGGFLWGEGSGGEVEAIPIVGTEKIEVITVSYRQGPEHKFPAASEDVASVYKALLRDYKPTNIGIYGCSAGGILTAESIAWFGKVGLPMPGAIGTFCGSAAPIDGDSAYVAPGLNGNPGSMAGVQLSLPYFKGADPNDPMLFPILSAEVMARFPPTLLIAGSRDYAVSSLFRTQEELTRLGVYAELHVWDGMWHAFFVHPDLPESREVYAVVARFFSQHLGKEGRQ